jgi:hypothetical protein
MARDLAAGRPITAREMLVESPGPGAVANDRLVKIRTGVDPQWTGGAELHRSDCETNSYDAGPCDCGTAGVTAELLDQLVADARAELAHALGAANRNAPQTSRDLITRHWRRSRPGFARLLDLIDRS